MQKGVGWLWVVGFFGLLSAVHAQTPPPSTAGVRFDGTYAFVSSTKLAKTYTAQSGRMGQCPNRIAGPLTIVNGQARYSISNLRKTAEFEGTVGSRGELAMRLANVNYRIARPTLSGRIDGNGTVSARQIGLFVDMI